MSKVRFGDILYIKGRIGWQALSKDEYLQHGEYYLVTGVDITDTHRIDFSNCYYVSKERYEMDDKIQLKVGDIIVTKDGTIGKIGIIDKLDKPATLNSHLFLIRNEAPEVLDTDYLFQILRSKTFQKFALNNTHGSNIPAFTQANISEFEIDLPSLETQRKVSKILKNIDNKIVNNIELNKELESIAKTLYDYWFLQFEFPNEEEKPYKSSGGKMVYNEELKREIPEGWDVANIINNPLSKVIKAGVDKFDKKNYLPTANIEGEQVTDGDYVTFENRESRANMQPKLNSVWFAKMKNSIKHLSIPSNGQWFVDKYILSTGYEGLECENNSFAYLHSIINSSYFEKYKDTLSHGATQEGVNDEDLKNVKFVVPDDNVLKEFAKTINPLLEKKFANIRENQKLAELRDFLLPMLMNGQVTFKEK